MSKTLYIFNLDGKLYWGSYGSASYMGVICDWLMRRTPMKENHWYGNAEHQVAFERFIGQDDERQFILKHRRSANEERLVAVRKYQPIVMIACSSTLNIKLQRLDEARSNVGCFRNRLEEYEGSYLIPLSKKLKTRLKAA